MESIVFIQLPYMLCVATKATFFSNWFYVLVLILFVSDYT